MVSQRLAEFWVCDMNDLTNRDTNLADPLYRTLLLYYMRDKLRGMSSQAKLSNKCLLSIVVLLLVVCISRNCWYWSGMGCASPWSCCHHSSQLFAIYTFNPVSSCLGSYLYILICIAVGAERRINSGQSSAQAFYIFCSSALLTGGC